MSDADFDAAWLQLREPRDAAAFSRPLAQRFAARLGAGPRLIDLGAGTGSNARLLAPLLPAGAQHWLLVDQSEAVLAAARPAMTAWATAQGWKVTGDPGPGLALDGPDRRLLVETLHLDIDAGLDALPLATCDGLLAKALLDIVSADWLQHLARLLAAAGRPSFLTSLNVDGRVTFSVPDAADAAVLARFHAHMRRDKGFGPALGPELPDRFQDVLTAAGYQVERAASDWQVGQDDLDLHLAMLAGYERAAAAQDPGFAAAAAAWGQRRRALARDGATLTVGHADLLALA